MLIVSHEKESYRFFFARTARSALFFRFAADTCWDMSEGRPSLLEFDRDFLTNFEHRATTTPETSMSGVKSAPPRAQRRYMGPLLWRQYMCRSYRNRITVAFTLCSGPHRTRAGDAGRRFWAFASLLRAHRHSNKGMFNHARGARNCTIHAISGSYPPMDI